MSLIFAFDPVTNTLWDTENGEDKCDEVNVVNQVLTAADTRLWVQYQQRFLLIAG
jgi:hypothetical protein